MIDNFGFRINKYFKVSLIIGIIDFIIFLIVGKICNYMFMFDMIMENWNYIFLYIGVLVVTIYLFDILFFYDRIKKYNFLLLHKEPFKNWQSYIKKEIAINSKDVKLDFYLDIYSKIANNDKIKGIRNDEVMIRDVSVHLIFTNLLLLILFFIMECVELYISFFCISLLLLFYIVLNISYRNYLKYYISEIYIEYIKEINK